MPSEPAGDYTLVRPPPIEDGRLWDDRAQRWVELKPPARALLAGLGADDDVAAAVARYVAAAEPEAPRESAVAAARARTYLLALHHRDIVKLHVAPPQLPAGLTLGAELGRGGTAVAYAATGSAGEALVAKVAWPFFRSVDKANAALEHEARLFTLIDSPHAPHVRDCFALSDGRVVLVRDHVAGLTLTELVLTGPAPAAAAVKRIVADVAALLTTLHAAGHALVDIKPGNFLDDGATTRVLDVGFAVPFGTVATPRATPGFVPPELVRERRVDARSDVWGIGRLYQFLLTGKLYVGPLVATSRLVADAPESARAAIATLCAEDPDERPATAAAALALVH